MRKLIAAMKVSMDGKVGGADGTADWVNSWSEDYGLTPQIDACLLGGGMYPGYESYWSSIHADPQSPAWITGAPPSAAELEWAGLVTELPHYVLSGTLVAVKWPQTRLLRTLGEVSVLKEQEGKSIYLVGGATLTAALIDAGLVDELRLIVYPLIAGDGQGLFSSCHLRRKSELREVGKLPDGRVSLIYDLG